MGSYQGEGQRKTNSNKDSIRVEGIEIYGTSLVGGRPDDGDEQARGPAMAGVRMVRR